MKTKLLLTPLLFPLLLTSCSRPMHENAIYTFNYFLNKESSDIQLITITSGQFLSMANGGMTFPVLIYSETCSSCINANSIINSYILDSRNVIFRLAVDHNNLYDLNQFFPELFYEEMTVPKLYIFDNGELTYTFNSNELTKKNTFSKKASLMFKRSNTLYILDKDILKQEFGLYSKKLLIAYDSRWQESVSFMSKVTNTYSFKNKAETIVLDLHQIPTATAEYLRSYFSLEETLPAGFVSVLGEQEIKNFVYYMDGIDEINEANSIVESFYL